LHEEIKTSPTKIKIGAYLFMNFIGV
jgi:hypothetical protein